MPTKFALDQPIDEDDPSGPKRRRAIRTTGCERRAMFLVNLLPEEYFLEDEEAATSPLFDFDDSKHPRAMMSDGETPAMARVCAVDDSMGLWPRYIHTMHTGESFEVI